MKKCPSCDIIYPDKENFCISCGAMLVPLMEKHMRKETKERETKKLEKKIMALEGGIKRLNSLEGLVRKNKERIDKIKFLPKNEVISLLDNVSELREKMENLDEKLSEMKPIRLSGGRKNVFVKSMESLQKDIARLDLRITNLSKRLGKKPEKFRDIPSEIQQELEKQISNAANDLRKEISGFIGDIRKTKEEIEKIKEWKKDLNEIKTQLKTLDVNRLENEFENINKRMDDINRKTHNKINVAESRIIELDDRIKDMEALTDSIKNLDTENITRKLEGIKTKTEWLEGRLESLNLEELIKRIEELEEELREARSSSPLILE